MSSLELTRAQLDLIRFANPLGSGVAEVLPATPLQSWDYVKVKTEKLPRENRYVAYASHAFRPIRIALGALADRLNGGVIRSALRDPCDQVSYYKDPCKSIRRR